MAEDLHYSSSLGESNKRKYEDHQASPPPVPRRATGFSSAPDASGPPASYNNVPPPMSEIELAKQKAQEIAARLLNNVDPMKKARVDNGAGGGGGFDSSDAGMTHKQQGFGSSGPLSGSSYGYPGPGKKIEIPNGRVGVIIGKGGETIKYLQLQSGAKIQVTRDMDADLNSSMRGVELTGTPDQIAKAEQLINDVLSEAEAGGSGVNSRRMTGSSGSEQFVMMVANNKVGLVIGKGGETIKSMQAKTGARIQVIPLHLPPGDMSKERTVQIDGTSEQIEAAKQLINEVTSEVHSNNNLVQNRPRNSSMTSGYPQQGYQNRPPSWAIPGTQIQQPGYGYGQPGGYSAPPQYNMNQPPYSGYPTQHSSGAYATGWDQTTAANQQNTQGGGYDYYSQQAPPQQQVQGSGGAPTDSSGYGYNQQLAYNQGQGYVQDNYGSYHASTGYGQPQPNPGAGYEQQQSYNSAYGSTANPTLDGHTSYGAHGDANQTPASGQPYNATGQPSPNTNYPPQASSQPGYGMPPSSQAGYGTQQPSSYGSYGNIPGQKPTGTQAAYAQPQQSPSGQGSGYAQPGYPHSQPPPSQAGYAQPESGPQKPLSSGYPTSQTGYGPPTYGASPATQPGYGQQPPYNGSYASGYSQPEALPSDASAGAYPRGTYDAVPPPAQPSGAAKASPPSG